MMFRDANLPNHDLVREAFSAAYDRVMTGDSFKTACAAVESNVRRFYKDQVKLYLNTQDRDDFRKRLKDSIAERREDLARVPDIARDVLEADFATLCIDQGPVRVLLEGDAEASPQLLAAALLLPTVLTDADEEEVAGMFGDEVGDLIRAARHMPDDPDMEFYSEEDKADFANDLPDPRDERDNLAEADPEAQLLYYAKFTAALKRDLDETKAAMRADPKLKPEMQAGRDAALFDLASVVYGRHPGLDFIFRDSFNQYAELTGGDRRLQEDRLGVLEMISAAVHAPVRQEVKPKTEWDRSNVEPPSVGVL